LTKLTILVVLLRFPFSGHLVLYFVCAFLLFSMYMCIGGGDWSQFLLMCFLYMLSSFLVQMDLETENRIAAILLKEAAELRRQAQQEGVLAYLRKPTVRGRPNSRFLTATVRGIQQGQHSFLCDCSFL